MTSLQSADEMLEQGVLALYRQWPHLPRRTTIPALDRLRAALAALNEEVSVPAQFSVITETKTISRSFVMEGGLSIDIESAIQQID
ncbi:MAG: hypothetical protein ACK4SA_25325, partial [Caldilinea sp.]